MRYEDERYVRVYTRDTATWKLLTWEGKAVLALLFRKVDRAGLADLGENRVEGLAALLDIPIELAEPGLASILARKVALLIGPEQGTLLIPNFLAAQEAHTSDAQRKRDQRERAAAQQTLTEASRSVTEGHASGQNVTPSHSTSQVVTPCLSVPSLSMKTPSEGNTIAPPAEQPSLALEVQEQEDPGAAAQREMAEAVTHYQRRWVETFKPADGLPPKLSQGDRGQLRQMLKTHGAETWRGFLERYLADQDPKLAADGYALALMTRRLNGYRATAVPRTRNGPLEPMEPVTESYTETM